MTRNEELTDCGQGFIAEKLFDPKVRLPESFIK